MVITGQDLKNVIRLRVEHYTKPGRPLYGPTHRQLARLMEMLREYELSVFIHMPITAKKTMQCSLAYALAFYTHCHAEPLRSRVKAAIDMGYTVKMDMEESPSNAPLHSGS